jgi:hypothetical protein
MIFLRVSTGLFKEKKGKIDRNDRSVKEERWLRLKILKK